MSLYVANFYGVMNDEAISEIIGVFNDKNMAFEALFTFLINNEYIFSLDHIRNSPEGLIEKLNADSDYFKDLVNFIDFVETVDNKNIYKDIFGIFLKKSPGTYEELDHICEVWESNSGYEHEWHFGVEECILNQALTDDRAE